MRKVLANDGIHPTGQKMLEDAGFEVDTNKIPQEELPEKLPAYDAICVRSATKIRQPLIDQCPDLKVIARGGVGLDNIDVDYARSKGIAVMNTPAASSRSVAELVMGHVLNLSRFLHLANREMPDQGSTEFKVLKKRYSKGIELGGRTLGVIGMGRIGQETARLAAGMGMNILATDLVVNEMTLAFDQFNPTATLTIPKSDLDTLLAESDVITLHVPFVGKAIIGAEELGKMKKGAILINAARGGVVDDHALLEALNSGHLAGAGLDVFEEEPTPKKELLNHDRVSASPHIGASTGEAQERIGIELAEQIIAHFGA